MKQNYSEKLDAFIAEKKAATNFFTGVFFVMSLKSEKVIYLLEGVYGF